MDFEDLCETKEEITNEPKRYKVCLTYERIVFADSEEAAYDIAEEVLNDEAYSDGIISDDFRVEQI